MFIGWSKFNYIIKKITSDISFYRNYVAYCLVSQTVLSLNLFHVYTYKCTIHLANKFSHESIIKHLFIYVSIDYLWSRTSIYASLYNVAIISKLGSNKLWKVVLEVILFGNFNLNYNELKLKTPTNYFYGVTNNYY